MESRWSGPGKFALPQNHEKKAPHLPTMPCTDSTGVYRHQAGALLGDLSVKIIGSVCLLFMIISVLLWVFHITIT